MATSSSTLDEAPAKRVARVRPQEDWWAEAWAVFAKDVRSELRTRAAVSTILLFALVTLTVVAFTVTTQGPGFQEAGVDTKARALVQSSLLWIVLFFSAMAGLPRTFVKEEEMRTVAALRLAARPSAVFAGKLFFNAGLMLLVAVVVLVPFLLLLTPQVRNWPLFLTVLIAGALAMAGSATILGAIVARAGGKTYLMVPLAFPVLLPVLVFTINGSAEALRGNGGNQVIALVSYLVAMTTLSAMLFEKVWSDA